MNKYLKLLGYAPDADPTTPGIITDCNFMIPSPRGYRALPAPIPADGTAFGYGSSSSVWPDSTVINARVFRVPTNTIRVVAGTAAKIWMVQYTGDVTTTPTTSLFSNYFNASRASGYSASVQQSWIFEQFGDYILAAKGAPYGGSSITLQAYNSVTANFEDVSAAPAGAVMITSDRFVLLFNIASYAQDAWWCCARDDHTNWSLSPATLCTRGRLVDTDGPITAAGRLGNDIIAFKTNSMYRGRMVDTSEVWQWELTPFTVGCIAPLAVANDRTGLLYFLGTDNLYSYDGAQVQGLMDGILAQSFLTDFQPQNNVDLQPNAGPYLVFDEARNMIVVSYLGMTGNCLLFYHVPTKRWGRAQYSSSWFDCIFPIRVDYEAVGAAQTGAIVGYAPNNQVLGMFKTDHKAYQIKDAYDGSAWPVVPYLTIGDIGDDYVDTELISSRLRFTIAPSAGTATGYHRNNLDASLTTAAPVARTSDGKFETRQTDRWHRLKFEFQGDVEVLGYVLDFDVSGLR